MVHACDFSKTAVQVMRESEHYNPKFISADVWDVTAVPDEENNGLPPGLTEGSVDVVILIFIFSALAPSQWDQAIRNVYRVLKPGGLVLFRDYGRGDLAQVRFKKGRYMDENFYVRGDGTRVYFFEKEQLEKMWGTWTPEKGLQMAEDNSIMAESEGAFDVEKIGVDRRLIVNRQRKLKMYRCWIQAHYRKRETPAAVEAEKADS